MKFENEGSASWGRKKISGTARDTRSNAEISANGVNIRAILRLDNGVRTVFADWKGYEEERTLPSPCPC